jgi:hypothetical protein
MMLSANKNKGEANDTSKCPIPPYEWKMAEPTNRAMEPEARPITNFAISTYIASRGMKVPFSPRMSMSKGPIGRTSQMIHHKAGNSSTPTATPLKPGN